MPRLFSTLCSNFTIAHRLSTIKDADMIYVMGDGFLLEQGIHDDLMALGGAYAKLIQMQRLHEDQ
jgi:ATP-binding cassette subfamily B (MDR/TAP) protein 1